MNTERIERLLDKFMEGKSSEEEERELRTLLTEGDLPDQLLPYRELFEYYREAGRLGPDRTVDPLARIDFGEADAGSDARRGRGTRGAGAHSPRRMRRLLQVAAGLILLLTGFASGVLVGSGPADSQQVAALQEEIRQMKQVLVYGTGGHTSASERISAINFSSRLPGDDRSLDGEIRDILVFVMNSDRSVNVRLEAAEALYRYREQPDVRQALAGSLSRQRNPLMQLSLIDMLVSMNEKSAVSEMQKLMMNPDTHELVQEELEAGIAELRSDNGV